MRVILDSDYGPDVDDLVAHAVLHALADLDECEIIAEIACISNANSPGAMNAVDTWHGRPSIPVGGFRGTIGHTGGTLFPNGGAGGESDGDAWAISIYNASATYPRTVDNTTYPDAVDVYRQALHDAPDASVRIITIGMLNTLAELLNSPADSIDERTGSALIAAKVEAVYVMGGRNSGAEFNLRFAREEAADVADNLPVPIYWSQAEIGGTIFTGRWTGTDRAGHIVRFGMEEFNFVPGSDGNGRQSWDAMNVMAAVRGVAAGFSWEQGTMTVNADDGANTWVASGAGPHFRASKTKTDAEYEADIEPLVWTAEFVGTPIQDDYDTTAAVYESGGWSTVSSSGGSASLWSDWSAWILGETSAGPAFTENLADTAGITDTLTTALGYSRSIADTAGTSDTLETTVEEPNMAWELIQSVDFTTGATIPAEWVAYQSGIWTTSGNRLRGEGINASGWLDHMLAAENLSQAVYQRYDIEINLADDQSAGSMHGIAARLRYDTGGAGSNSFYLFGLRRVSATSVQLQYYSIVDNTTVQVRAFDDVTVPSNAEILYRVELSGASPTAITASVINRADSSVIESFNFSDSTAGLQEAGYFALNRWQHSSVSDTGAVIAAVSLYGDDSEITPEIVIMPIGDSITHGIEDGERTYRWWLHEHLVTAGAEFEFAGPSNTPNAGQHHEQGQWDSRHSAVSGNRTTGVTARIGSDITTYQPDIALLYIGINDFLLDQKTVAATMADYEEVIDTIRAAKSDVGFILATLTRTSSANAPDATVDAFNEDLRAFAITKSTEESPVVIADTWLGYVSATHNRDGVHPNQDGEQRLAMRFADALFHHFSLGAYWEAPNTPTLSAPGDVLTWDEDAARADVYDIERNGTVVDSVSGSGHDPGMPGMYRVRGRRVIWQS